MRLRTVLSKTASWQTYGVSARSARCIDSNTSCGFYRGSRLVGENVLAFVLYWLPCALSGRGALIANTNRGCARSNALRLEISANLVINLTRYGYDGTRCVEKKFTSRILDDSVARGGLVERMGLGCV
jgi:hypothetical protein